MSLAIHPENSDSFSRSKEKSIPLLSSLKHIDWPLLVLTLVLTLFGLYGLRGSVDGIRFLERAVERQYFFLGVGLFAMIAVLSVSYQWINRIASAVYVGNLLVLIFVLVKGVSVNGADRWISIGPVNFQPSETMKIATVLVLAQWLALRPENLKTWKGLLPPCFICGLPALLILMQPDLGTSAVFFFIMLVTLLFAGAPKRILALLIFATCLGAVSAYPFLKPYQKARVMVFMNPEADPRGAGYNLIQSKIAIGNGGLTGQGWGEGTQCTHRFLPEHHTDFIFSALVEQFGFLGGMGILALYLLIFWRLIYAAEIARDRFGGLMVIGLMTILASHVFCNIGMTMGLLPVTGLPLPFLSYGGSFLVANFLLIGLVMNVASRRYVFISDD